MKRSILLLLLVCISLFNLVGQEIIQIKRVNVDTLKAYKAGDSDSLIFTVVEEMPHFPGGEDARYQYLAENLNYPVEARVNGIQGRVFVTFVVEKDGSISNVRVLRGIGGGCDEEAVRVVSNMPRWKPGRQRGNPVRVQFNMPLLFKLNEEPLEVPATKDPYQAGLEFLNMEAYDEAINQFDLCIENLNDHSSEAYFMRGICNYQLGSYEKAANDMMTAQNTNAEVDRSQLSTMLFLVANELLIQDKTDFAITVYSRSLELDPENGRAYLNRAFAYQKKGDDDLAHDDFKMARKLGYPSLDE